MASQRSDANDLSSRISRAADLAGIKKFARCFANSVCGCNVAFIERSGVAQERDGSFRESNEAALLKLRLARYERRHPQTSFPAPAPLSSSKPLRRIFPEPVQANRQKSQVCRALVQTGRAPDRKSSKRGPSVPIGHSHHASRPTHLQRATKCKFAPPIDPA